MSPDAETLVALTECPATRTEKENRCRVVMSPDRLRVTGQQSCEGRRCRCLGEKPLNPQASPVGSRSGPDQRVYRALKIAPMNDATPNFPLAGEVGRG